MDKLKPKVICCTNPSDRTLGEYWDEDEMADKINEIVKWINKCEEEQELKELRLFERIVKMIDKRVRE